jgi:hypothetical protein
VRFERVPATAVAAPAGARDLVTSIPPVVAEVTGEYPVVDAPTLPRQPPVTVEQPQSQEPAPIFEELARGKFRRLFEDLEEWDKLIAPPEPWNLPGRQPAPIEEMIRELCATLPPSVVWKVEREIGQDAMLAALVAEVHRCEGNDGEETDDGSSVRSADDADVADGPGGPLVLDGPGGADPAVPGQG